LPQSLQKGTPSMDSKKYVGMNVHKESISIAVMNGAGKIVMECVIETKASMILQFIDGLRGDLQVTFEQGTSAAWLYDLLKPVLRQNAIRAENGAILFCHGGDKEPALDQEFLSGPRRFLLGGNVGAPAAWICVRIGKKLSGLSGSIVTVMQPTEAIRWKSAPRQSKGRLTSKRQSNDMIDRVGVGGD